MQNSLDFLHSELFRQVQVKRLFDDGKTFADAELKSEWREIEQDYNRQSQQESFDLLAFVHQHFVIPQSFDKQENEAAEQAEGSVRVYIEKLWSVLAREPDAARSCSLLPLSHPYIVPGGRFREIYYWDSYFTGLGLVESGRVELLQSMISNFIELQDVVGCIPNGNRSYYDSRSQPPVLALMVELLLSHKSTDAELLQFCIDGLEKEYDFWMRGEETLSDDKSAVNRVVRMTDGSVLNRYWDDRQEPRPESFREDIEAAAGLNVDEKGAFFRNVRAACESGWDFSSRWLANPGFLASIQTTSIIPVDLNCLLYNLEMKLANLLVQTGQPDKASEYQQKATLREQAIQRYLWDEQQGWYYDYHIGSDRRTEVNSLAGVLPMFVNIATGPQGTRMCQKLVDHFLKQGGLVTTLTESPQQWDSPNGWAPLHWFAVQGLMKYGYEKQARVIMQLWIATVEQHFEDHGYLMEKYNVESTNVTATGGEYVVQHGFGWTNGVTLAFYHLLEASI